MLRCRGAAHPTLAMAKQLHFNKNGEALKKMQAGVDKLASVVGVTLGPKVRTPERRQRRVCKRRATFAARLCLVPTAPDRQLGALQHTVHG